MQAEKPRPTHDIIPPDGCQSSHPTECTAGLVDTHADCVCYTQHTGSSWDVDHTPLEEDKIHTPEGSNNDLPPESISNTHTWSRYTSDTLTMSKLHAPTTLKTSRQIYFAKSLKAKNKRFKETRESNEQGRRRAVGRLLSFRITEQSNNYISF